MFAGTERDVAWIGGGDPEGADWNGDGLDDLLTPAGSDRNIVWYRNVGTLGRPKFESPRLLVPLATTWPYREAPDGQPGFHHAFCVADFNADGRPDLLLGDRFRIAIDTGAEVREQNLANNDRLEALCAQYDNLRNEVKSESRPERIDRYRKLLRTWQEYESLRLAGNRASGTRYEQRGYVWYFERIAPEGQR